ncbi:sulfatase-like hydrolase/transferase [Hoeflea ulvae]|uniref:Sulfatase-like hydrolase/transferase n=1 Tax=Hoeflea ulvae TaxID=2983764 RepID=A0ABT3YJ84_9HYPH|nr:sulfatase-like hydrolase/transferase [Hoeflea ulvae]MCY0095966.1 sulfatase-like hydrolase/transferase [Hoeflea ulvae]
MTRSRGKPQRMRLLAGLAAVAIIAAAFSTGPAAAQTASKKPNILLIIADDMGLDASRCYQVGEDQAPMPVVEELCRQGMVFDAAYAAPTCSPTRATMITGRYGFRTGVGAAITPQGGTGLSPDETSLFDVLGGNGYASAVIGKWHLAGAADGLDHPARLGVTDYYGTYKGAVKDYFHWDGVENGAAIEVDGYTTTDFTDRAINWVAAQQSPWFLWLAYNAPHAPFHLPPAELHSAGTLADDADEIRRNPLPYYNAMLEAMDTEIGRLLASMPEDVRANTMVMFIGDNGTPGKVAGSFYGARGAKGSIFEGGTHVPLIIQGPGIAAGRSDALVNSTDLFATIAAKTGIHPQTPDAVDLAPVLGGAPGTRSHVYVEHFSDVPPTGPDVYGWAIRDTRYKLVAMDDAQQMLFDLDADPLEQSDLLSGEVSSEARQAAAQLQATFEKLRQ